MTHHPAMADSTTPDPKSLSDRELIAAYNELDEEPDHPLSQALSDEIERRELDL